MTQGPPAKQNWFGFCTELRQRAGLSADELLMLICLWGDRQEAESPDSTQGMAQWMLEELGLAGDDDPTGPEPAQPEAALGAPEPAAG